MEAVRPRYAVGTRLRVRWPQPDPDDDCQRNIKKRRTDTSPRDCAEDCRIVAIAGPIKPVRQRRTMSHFVYHLEWAASSERSWTRLLHLDHEPVAVDTCYNDGSTRPQEFAAAEASDHAETPLNAYTHVTEILKHIQGQKTQHSKSDRYSHRTLRIYDPYFCQGAVVSKLADCGFFSVYNRNEDFYASEAWKLVMSVTSLSAGSSLQTTPRSCQNSGSEVECNDCNRSDRGTAARDSTAEAVFHAAPSPSPLFDVLLTNPPYSADHVDRLFQFSVSAPLIPFVPPPSLPLLAVHIFTQLHVTSAAQTTSCRQTHTDTASDTDTVTDRERERENDTDSDSDSDTQT